MELATFEDFQARFPRDLSQPELTRAAALIVDATALIRARTGFDWLDEGGEIVDPVATAVCIAVATRAFLNKDGTTSENVPGYGKTIGLGDVGVWITDAELETLRVAQAALADTGRSGIGVLRTTRGDIETPSVLDCDPIDEFADDVLA